MASKLLLFLLFVIIWGTLTVQSARPGNEEEGEDVERQPDVDLPDDPYSSYMLWPHFHFHGTFQADVSTVNNDARHYNMDNFVPADQLKSRSNWNARGTGEWIVSGSVTNVCYADGDCVKTDEVDPHERDRHTVDPILGAPILDGGKKSFAKMVDLDTEAQLFSEIWGWRIQIGDLFSAHYMPVPLQNIWNKMTVKHGDASLGAAYQSVLTNITWIASGEDSPFIQQLQDAMKNDNIDNKRLSIRFNVDMFSDDSRQSGFTFGRLTGTIGLLGSKSPPFFTHGRMMKTLHEHVQDTPFYVDQKNRKVFADFGNSVPIDESGNFNISILDDLVIAVTLDSNPTLTCSDDLLWLGLVHNKFPKWYQNTAGVQAFPSDRALSRFELRQIGQHPLVVAEVSGTLAVPNCKRIVLAERLDGVEIHPYNKWTFRKNPGERAHVQLFASKFGKPLPCAHVKIDPCPCSGVFSGPEIGQPPLPDVPSHVLTDENGIATFDIEVKDPKNNRSFIDGQLYAYMFSIENQNKNCEETCENDGSKALNSLVVVRAWDHYTMKGTEPTWLDDVYPIFKLYANLHPAMADIIDLANYYAVVNQRDSIKMSMELPMWHPGYMPVTRDLSASKRKVIVEWLSQEEPLFGDPQKFYSVEQLRKDLQTALELEHATIPPYLTALATIKKSYNLEIQIVVKTIVRQEMMHMALVANILNAVGGKPTLYSKKFIPRYPSRLPGGVQPDLVVPIEKMSLALIRNIFMKIEQPEMEVEYISSFKRVFSYINQHKKMGNESSCCRSKEMRGFTVKDIVDDYGSQDDDDLSSCFSSFSKREFGGDFHLHQPERRHKMYKKDIKTNIQPHARFPDGNTGKAIVKHHNTIGGFYHHILNALGNLTDCGKNNSIFTGDPSKQVDVKRSWVHGHSLKVYDYFTAVEAIQDIVEQGEGSSPCNPVAWDTGEVKDLSHYFLFYSIAEKREIQVVAKPGSSVNRRGNSMVDLSELCNGAYYFNGSKIPFDPEGVWPMGSNPQMSKYTPGSKAYRKAKRFNKAYTRLLRSLEDVFNGHPESMKDAYTIMYSIDLHLKNLVRMPIDDNGDPDVGPNAGPTFDFTP